MPIPTRKVKQLFENCLLYYTKHSTNNVLWFLQTKMKPCNFEKIKKQIKMKCIFKTKSPNEIKIRKITKVI